MLKVFILMVCVVVLTSCGDLKIDATNDETLATSIKKITESLPPAEQKKFVDAVVLISINSAFSGGVINSDASGQEMSKALDGLTYKQVIAKSKELGGNKGIESIGNSLKGFSDSIDIESK